MLDWTQRSAFLESLGGFRTQSSKFCFSGYSRPNPGRPISWKQNYELCIPKMLNIEPMNWVWWNTKSCWWPHCYNRWHTVELPMMLFSLNSIYRLEIIILFSTSLKNKVVCTWLKTEIFINFDSRSKKTRQFSESLYVSFE